MTNGRGKRAAKRRGLAAPVPALDRSPPWNVIYHKAVDGSVPALEFLDRCPGKLDGEFTAVLDAVADAPPPQFSGGGRWEAMHGEMTGYHEIRLTGPGREQFRLFCLLENASDEELRRRGLTKPAIAVLDGRRKPWRTVLSARDPKRQRDGQPDRPSVGCSERTIRVRGVRERRGRRRGLAQPLAACAKPVSTGRLALARSGGGPGPWAGRRGARLWRRAGRASSPTPGAAFALTRYRERSGVIAMSV